MNDRDISKENSKKLDRLLIAVEGTEDYPGIAKRLSTVERLLYGEDGSGGVIQQHKIIWRIHTWLLSTTTGLIGVGVGLLLKRWIKSP